MRGLILSAPSSGQGKTVVALGFLRALRDRGVAVAAAKSGPDYIDPAFHAAACGAPCVTLDAWAADPEQLRSRAAMPPGDFLVVEGAMGLFDGARCSGYDPTGGEGCGATADVARALGLPIVLVLDAAGMGQSAGAIVLGFANRAPDVKIHGVILNRVAGSRHEAMLREGIGEICPVLGALPPDPTLALPSRHLGLVQAQEHADLEARIAAAAAAVSAHCDVGRLTDLATDLPTSTPPRRLPPLGQRTAVACDEAFGFGYWHQLEDWRAQGAEVLPFSPLADHAPDPDADAIFLPGGYPELHAGQLAAARTWRTGVRRAAKRGVKIYGECGGYMVLGNGIVDAEGCRHRMLGLLRLTTNFRNRRRRLGYRRAAGGPFAGGSGGGPSEGIFAAHEFHYSTADREEGVPLFASVADGSGSGLGAMGLRSGSVMGSFLHLIERVD